MDIKELDSYNLSDAVKFHKTLNPALWHKQSMQDEVQQALLQISQDFREFMGVTDIALKDITISGSNAAYSYTNHSDIDLHLVVDMNQLSPDEVFKELFDAKKYQYNDQHNIKIRGYDVELYVQPANEPHVSLGEYSILHNKWIRIPSARHANLNDIATKSKYEKLSHILTNAINSDSLDEVKKVAGILKKYRRAGLDQHGEFGPENLSYKMLRTQGQVQKLYDRINELQDVELSLESKKHKPSKKKFKYGYYGGTWYAGHNNEVSGSDGGIGEQLEEEIISEVAMSYSALSTWANSSLSEGIRIGFEAELAFEDVSEINSDFESEPDYDLDERATSIDSVINFFKQGEFTTSRQMRKLRDDLDDGFSESIFDKANTDWTDNEETYIRDYITDNFYSDIQQLASEYLDTDDQDKIDKKSKELLEERIEDCIKNRDAAYQDAMESHQLDYFNDSSDGDWLQSDYPYMTDIERAFNVPWPYYTSSGDGQLEWEYLSNSLKGVVKQSVVVSTGYHVEERTNNKWILEPDTSIIVGSGAGIEVISPPMPLHQGLDKLEKVLVWAKANGGTTNASTGLHIGVSVAKPETVDHVKLLLFVGDEYVLKQYGREFNNFCNSVLRRVREEFDNNFRNTAHISTVVDSATNILKTGFDKIANTHIRDVVKDFGEKHTVSIGIRDGYVEFRGMGSDYLNNDVGQTKATVLRFARAMQIASDPQAEQQDYAKKLYKLISLNSTSFDSHIMNLFSSMSANKISNADFKHMLKELLFMRKNHDAEFGKGQLALPGVDPSKIQKKPTGLQDLSTKISTARDWYLIDQNNIRIHTFYNLNDSQSDADAAAAQWLQQNRPYTSRDAEFTVVPVER